MIKRTFVDRGPDYACQLALENSQDLLAILKWNEDNGIKFFRISSGLIPWASEFDIKKNQTWQKIKAALSEAGQFARNHGHRITMHPGAFNCLASPNETVIENSIKDLTIHGLILDTMNMPRSPDSAINIHVGGAYGDHDKAAARFCDTFEKLPVSVQARLTVENDDRPGLYNTTMLYEGIHKRIGIPIMFDSLHHACGPDDNSFAESLSLAASTWPQGVTPVCHHSSSKKVNEDSNIKSVTAHADYLYELFDSGKVQVDLMLEAKAKELALFKYAKEYA
jgi:UV DNA damage endonuclease